MHSSRSLCLLIASLLMALHVPSQNVNTMHPEPIQVQKHASPEDMRARFSQPSTSEGRQRAFRTLRFCTRMTSPA